MSRTLISESTRRPVPASAAQFGGATGLFATARAQSMEKEAVRYRASPHGEQRCGTCAFWSPAAAPVHGAGTCAMVLGGVGADAWCAIWSPAD